VVIVHTVGHSTLALDDFIALLRAHGVTAVADVRRFPASRRHPHFAREALAAALEEAGIEYSWLPALGGRRSGRPDSRHLAWRNESFRAYADHMETAEFTDGLATLLALARRRSTAVMCAEAAPWRCHRQLIADALLAGGEDVCHITGLGRAAAHRLTAFARVLDGRVVYDDGQPSLVAASRAPDDRR
jgi:uncharacterized protein (DUF488 family)